MPARPTAITAAAIRAGPLAGAAPVCCEACAIPTTNVVATATTVRRLVTASFRMCQWKEQEPYQPETSANSLGQRRRHCVMRTIGAFLFLFAFALGFAEPSSGRVLYRDGRPAAGARVHWVQGMGIEAAVVRVESADANGFFQFKEPPAQRAMHPDGLLIEAEGAGLTYASPYHIRSHPDIYLARPTTLHVKLVDANGTPMAGVKVAVTSLFLANGSASIPAGFPGVQGKSDDKGWLHIPKLPQGSQAVLASADPRFTEIMSAASPLSGDDSYRRPMTLYPASSLTGRLVDPKGKPVAGVPIVAHGTTGRYRTVTAADGLYRFAGIRPGEYAVLLGVPAKGVSKVAAKAISGIRVGLGSNTVAPRMTTVPSGILSGQITDVGSGNPRSNLVVRVKGPGAPTENVAQMVSTDGQGKYAIRVPAGQSQVSLVWEPFKQVSVPDGKTVRRDLAIRPWPNQEEPKSKVTVTVLDANGKPVPFAELIQDAEYGFGGPTYYVTDAQGQYVFRGFEVRPPITLRAQMGSDATPESVTITSETEVTLRLVPGLLGRIEGVLVNSEGQPQSGVPVMLFEQRASIGWNRAVAMTDSQGRYRFSELWPELRYRVHPGGDDWTGEFSDQLSLASGEEVKLPPLKVKPAKGTLAGIVVDPKGQPVAGVQVATERGSRYTSTDSKGKFLLSGLSEEDFTLTVGPDPSAQQRVRAEPGQRNLRIVFDKKPDPNFYVSRPPAPNPLVGKGAPELQSGPDLDGQTIRLADLRGKIVVLDFWGTDCGPCIGALPGVRRIHSQFKGKGVVVIGLHHSDGKADEMRKFAKDHAMSYHLVIDSPNTGLSFGKTFSAYGVNGIPSVVVIGRDGKVVAADISIEEAFTKVGELLGAGK